MMDRFGLSKVKSVKKTLTPEELQARVMAVEQKNNTGSARIQIWTLPICG